MKVPNNEQNMGKCKCGDCPSYMGGGEGFFCAMGKSKMIKEQKGCLCGSCAIFAEYKLADGYFCGSGAAQ